MASQNDNKTHHSEVQRDYYNDANGNAHTSVTRTEETVKNSRVEPEPNSYGHGYVHGRVAERSHQEEGLADRDNNTAARGLLLGILLTSLVGLTAGTIFFLNQRNEAPVPATPPVVVPKTPEASPSPAASQAPEKTTIIERERTRNVVIPVPTQQSPAPPAPAPAPKINISVPPAPAPQPPAARQEPPTQTSPSESPSQSERVPAQSKQSDTSTSTASPEATQSSNDTSSSPNSATNSDSSTPAQSTTSGSDSNSGADSTGSSGQ